MIADFGCMTQVTEATVTGDPRYRAPEAWQGEKLNYATDVRAGTLDGARGELLRAF